MHIGHVYPCVLHVVKYNPHTQGTQVLIRIKSTLLVLCNILEQDLTPVIEREIGRL